MANRRNRNGGNGNIQNRIAGRQQRTVASVAGQFANALIKGNDEQLARMTLYTQETGGIGSDASNVTKLKKSGANAIKRVFADGKTGEAFVLFSNGAEVTSIGRFKVIGGHVMGDWDLYTQ